MYVLKPDETSHSTLFCISAPLGKYQEDMRDTSQGTLPVAERRALIASSSVGVRLCISSDQSHSRDKGIEKLAVGYGARRD